MNNIEEIKAEIEKLEKSKNNEKPELKSGYRVTLRNGYKYIVVDANTKYFTGLCLVDPTKDSHNWINYIKYIDDVYGSQYDIVKVEKLYHPYSMFYKWQENYTEVLWEESVENVEEDLKELKKKLNELEFPELKSGYQITRRDGSVMLVMEVNTSYYSGLALVHKDHTGWSTVSHYKGSKNDSFTSFDIVKVEKLYHPNSVLHKQENTVVLWEENED